MQGNDKKRGCLPNAENVYKVWSSGNREKINTDKRTLQTR